MELKYIKFNKVVAKNNLFKLYLYGIEMMQENIISLSDISFKLYLYGIEIRNKG